MLITICPRTWLFICGRGQREYGTDCEIQPKICGGGGTVTSCPFPVGFGGFFQTDPSTIYAGTTWEQKKDVFILAAGDTYPAGSTGGEAEHVLTEAEMPKHYHTGWHWYGPDNNAQFGVNYYGATGISKKGVWKIDYTDTASEAGLYTGYSGGSQPHNNMPPYYAMPFWIRTA